MSGIGRNYSNEKRGTIKITDVLNNKSESMEFLDSENYFNLPACVSQKFGLYVNQFQLRRERENKMYPSCVDHIMFEHYVSMREMDVKDNDHVFIIHIIPTDQSKQLPAHSELNVASCVHRSHRAVVEKRVQTEDGSAACDVIKLNVYIFYDGRENFDIYVRTNDTIIDFTIAVLKKCTPY